MYKVRINLIKYLSYIFFSLWAFAVILELLAFSFSGSWSDVFAHLFTSAHSRGLIFILVAGLWFPIQFGLMFTAFGAVLLLSLRCTLTPDGVEYSRALIFRNTMLWNEIDDVRSQWGYFVLRKKLPEGVWSDMERVNNVYGSKVCCLPKASLVKDREGFLAYLNQVVPAGSAIRACYFPPSD